MEYMFKGFGHLGIRTDDPEKCAEFYIRNLDFRPFHTVQRPNFKIVMVENSGLILEFIGSGKVEEAGMIAHYCIEVVNIEKCIERLVKAGVVPEGAQPKNMGDFYPFPTKNFNFIGPAGENVELFDFSNN